MDNIKYTSDNGYTGILYGTRSLTIIDQNGIQCMHTGSRDIDTYGEKVEGI